MNLKEKYRKPPIHSYISTSSNLMPITEKNIDCTPYIDLVRWGFVFFRELNPFRRKKLAVANTPSSFLADAKTTKGERVYHSKYVKYFFDQVNKNSPTNHDLVKIGEKVEKPKIKDREKVNLKKYLCKNSPRTLNSKEFKYVKNILNDFHSLSF